MYRLLQSGTKTHYILDPDVLEEIKFDLRARFSEPVEVQELTRDKIAWDPGGMVSLKSPLLEFKLDKVFTLKVREQHVPYLLEQVYLRNAEGPRGDSCKYYKLHGYWDSVVLSTWQFTNLIHAIESKPDLRKDGEMAMMEHYMLLEKLNDHPNLHLPTLKKDKLDA